MNFRQSLLAVIGPLKLSNYVQTFSSWIKRVKKSRQKCTFAPSHCTYWSKGCQGHSGQKNLMKMNLLLSFIKLSTTFFKVTIFKAFPRPGPDVPYATLYRVYVCHNHMVGLIVYYWLLYTKLQVFFKNRLT